MQKVIQRTCIGCNEKKDKRELIRIVLNKLGNIFIDDTGKSEGRGAYLCNNKECIEKAVKSKRLERSFKMKISEEVYEQIKEMMNQISKTEKETNKINGGDYIG